MYTRCPACHTAHPLNASLLAQGGGKYRCGKCKKINNALEALFDEWPGPGDKPPVAGDLPDLGMSIDLEKARQSRLAPDEKLADEGITDPVEPRKRGSLLVRLSWITMALAVAIVVVYQLAEFYETPVLDSSIVRSARSQLGLQPPVADAPFRDLAQIQLVSRELRSHPFREDSLRLTATIVNRAPRAQAFPDLEVILLDVGGQEVSTVRFSPEDYLNEGESGESGMTPEAYLPLVLDLPDPGNEAVGFELNFL